MSLYSVPIFSLKLVMEPLESQELFRIETPGDVIDFFTYHYTALRHSNVEQFVAVLLNARREIIGINPCSKGTVAEALVGIGEVFKAALLANACAVIFVHNHPSGGKLEASEADLATTKSLIAAGKLLGVDVMDHIIVGPRRGCLSIREISELWS